MDRSKTELTQNIQRLAALWLDAKGFKPVETEVYVDRAWIADVAGICTPTQTEAIALKLIKYPPKWGAVADSGKLYYEWQKTYSALPRRVTAIIEVKASVADFRYDKKWKRKHPANLCYVAMPAEMIRPHDYPKGWGVLLLSGDGLRQVVPAELHDVTQAQQLDTVMSLAICRDHITRYERFRTWQKEIRLADCERTVMTRFSNAISIITYILKGYSVEDALAAFGVRTKLPGYLLERLEALKLQAGQTGK